MTTTTTRPITAHQVKTTSVWAGWHSWMAYVGPVRNNKVLRVEATREDGGEWVVSTKSDLVDPEPVEIARVKTLKSVREVMAWLYNQAAEIADQPSLDEVLEQASKTARRKPASGVTPAEAGVQIGTIFYSSWGYDQTNVDFYEVVGLTPKGVKIRKVAQSAEAAGYGQDEVSAEAGHFLGGVETKMLRGSAQHPYLSLNSYSSASIWDGQAKYQTASGWGH